MIEERARNHRSQAALRRAGTACITLIIIAALAGTQTASADVVYTALEPPGIIIPPGTLTIDLDNDASADFVLTLDVFGKLTVGPINDGVAVVAEGAFGTGTARRYLTCETISGAHNFQAATLPMNGLWIGAENVYLGLRFTIAGENHLGWTHLDVLAGSSSPLLKGYAYNSLPESEPGGAAISPGLTEPPTITCPSDMSVSCNEPTDPAATGFATGTVTCGPPPVVSFEDVITTGECPHSHTIVRRWTATDSFAQTSHCDQTITVTDTTDPIISDLADLGVQCETDVPKPASSLAEFLQLPGADVSDNCSVQEAITITWIEDASDGNTCPETITRTYRAEDECGNTADTTQTIVVHDTTDPIITVPGDVTVECSADIPTPATDLARFLKQANADVSDNCSEQTAITIAWIGDTSDGNTCPETITRTYRTEDECGNTAEATQTIIVDDTIAPIVTAPADLAVERTEDVPTPAADLAEFLQVDGADVSDNCREQATITITWIDDTSDGNTCPETITRTYRAEDACGNPSECHQTILVGDMTPPEIISCPQDRTLPADEACGAVVPDVTNDVVATDNLDAELTVTQQPPAGTPLNLGSTDLAVTVTDDCGHEAICVFTVTVTDYTPPTIVTCPPPRTLEADATGVVAIPDLTAEVNAVDACSSDLMITQEPVAGTLLSTGETQVTITVTDNAGLKASCRLIITVQPPPEDNDPQPEPNPTPEEPQSTPGGCHGLFRALRQSLFGVPICGIGCMTFAPIMFAGLVGMKLRARQRRRPRR